MQSAESKVGWSWSVSVHNSSCAAGSKHCSTHPLAVLDNGHLQVYKLHVV